MTRSECQPTAFAAIIAGCVCAGSIAFGQVPESDSLRGDWDSSRLTLSVGSKLVDLEHLPDFNPWMSIGSPMKRPSYLEHVRLGVGRPLRRPLRVDTVDQTALPDPVNLEASPHPIRQHQVPAATARLPVPSTPIADGALDSAGEVSDFNLTQDQFAGLLASENPRSAEKAGKTGFAIDQISDADMPGRNFAGVEADWLISTVAVASVDADEFILPPDLLDRPKRRPESIEELTCLADAVYFEARGESNRGKQAVALTILNRVKSPRFPNTICGVVKQGMGELHRCQFSYYCDGRPEEIHELGTYRLIRQMASALMKSGSYDLTRGATHFHTDRVSPGWATHMRMRLTRKIGGHIFYQELN